MSVKLETDCAENIPSLEDLVEYKISHMSVITHGPGGGNPCITVTFGDETAARHWLHEWYNQGDDTIDPGVDELYEMSLVKD